MKDGDLRQRCGACVCGVGLNGIKGGRKNKKHIGKWGKKKFSFEGRKNWETLLHYLWNPSRNPLER